MTLGEQGFDQETRAVYDRFQGWMEVLNDAVEEGRITTSQARTLLLDIVKKAEHPWA